MRCLTGVAALDGQRQASKDGFTASRQQCIGKAYPLSKSSGIVF
jgi:hypothetical protein